MDMSISVHKLCRLWFPLSISEVSFWMMTLNVQSIGDDLITSKVMIVIACWQELHIINRLECTNHLFHSLKHNWTYKFVMYFKFRPLPLFNFYHLRHVLDACMEYIRSDFCHSAACILLPCIHGCALLGV